MSEALVTEEEGRDRFYCLSHKHESREAEGYCSAAFQIDALRAALEEARGLLRDVRGGLGFSMTQSRNPETGGYSGGMCHIPESVWNSWSRRIDAFLGKEVGR